MNPFSVVILAAGQDSFYGTQGDDIAIGTNAFTTFTGNGGDDIAFGLGNKDTINGSGGSDVLFGDGSCPPGTTNIAYCSTGETAGDGNDTINGGTGWDALFGQGGSDTIVGGADSDYIDGGRAHDDAATLPGGSLPSWPPHGHTIGAFAAPVGP